MTSNQNRHTKGLIDLMSMHTYEETLNEIDLRKADPNALITQENQSEHLGAGNNFQGGSQSKGMNEDRSMNSRSFLNDHSRLKPISITLQKHIQEMVEDYYKQHTLEVLCYCLEDLIPYNTELHEGDTFLHRLVEFGQLEAARHVLRLGVNTEIRTAINHKQFPRKSILCYHYLFMIFLRRDIVACCRGEWLS